MPLFKITTRLAKICNGERIEKGMSIEVVTQTHANPISSPEKQKVADAFMRVYGVDLVKAGALNGAYLEYIKIR